MALRRDNCQVLTLPASPATSDARLPPCGRWQWAVADQPAASTVALKMHGPGFKTASLQTITGPGMSPVNVFPGPDVYLEFEAATANTQVLIFADYDVSAAGSENGYRHGNS